MRIREGGERGVPTDFHTRTRVAFLREIQTFLYIRADSTKHFFAESYCLFRALSVGLLAQSTLLKIPISLVTRYIVVEYYLVGP
jgi:hypothetical protein